MPLSKISPWLQRDDYEAINVLSPADAELPATYDEWLSTQEVLIAKCQSNGQSVEKVAVRSSGLKSGAAAAALIPMLLEEMHLRCKSTISKLGHPLRQVRTPSL